MGRIFQPLLFLLAKCTRNQLIRHIEYLKAENQMLRARVPKKLIVLSQEERSKLMVLGDAIGPLFKQLITIVRYDTYLKWKKQLRTDHKPNKSGRPRTAEDVAKLVIKMAQETSWGYTRIIGELKKLGVTPPSRSTVKNILKAAGRDPGPRTGGGSWDEFLKIHAETLWQCDFFSQRVLTRTGFQQLFVMVFIHVATRRVIVSPPSAKLGNGWICEQTEAFFKQADEVGHPAKIVMRDNDRNYNHGFDGVVAAHGATVHPTAFRAPNENAYVERFIQSLQKECLSHFLVCGGKHLAYLVREYVRYYHECRPHQGVGNRVIDAPSAPTPSIGRSEVHCEQRLGGVLTSYSRAG